MCVGGGGGLNDKIKNKMLPHRCFSKTFAHRLGSWNFFFGLGEHEESNASVVETALENLIKPIKKNTQNVQQVEEQKRDQKIEKKTHKNFFLSFYTLTLLGPETHGSTVARSRVID